MDTHTTIGSTGPTGTGANFRTGLLDKISRQWALKILQYAYAKELVHASRRKPTGNKLAIQEKSFPI